MIVVLMGVAGAARPVGEALAARLGWSYFDADDFHPPPTSRRYAGLPLGDEDRWPWLDRLQRIAARAGARGRDAVLACSALPDTASASSAAAWTCAGYIWRAARR